MLMLAIRDTECNTKVLHVHVPLPSTWRRNLLGAAPTGALVAKFKQLRMEYLAKDFQ